MNKQTSFLKRKNGNTWTSSVRVPRQPWGSQSSSPASGAGGLTHARWPPWVCLPGNLCLGRVCWPKRVPQGNTTDPPRPYPQPLPPRRTHHLSCSEDRTTDTEEAAMAADPIHGCSTTPKGMKTPVGSGGSSQCGPEQVEGGPWLPTAQSPSTWVMTVSPQTPEGGHLGAGQWGCCRDPGLRPALTFPASSTPVSGELQGAGTQRGRGASGNAAGGTGRGKASCPVSTPVFPQGLQNTLKGNESQALGHSQGLCPHLSKGLQQWHKWEGISSGAGALRTRCAEFVVTPWAQQGTRV